MAEGSRNTILRQVYELDIQDQSKSMELQSSVSTLQDHQIQQVIDKVLGEFTSENHLYQFEHIELDLGQIQFEGLDRELPLRIENQLRSFLSRHIVEGEVVSEGKSVPLGTHLVEVFRHYLYYGYIQWQAGANESPSSLLAKMIEQHAAELTDLLRALGRYNAVIKRLVYQFNERELEQVVEVLTPESAKYIVTYKEHFIKAGEYEQTEQEEANRSNLRNKVWEVIFTFLLNKDKVTINNRQHFLRALITQVAQRNNETYQSLLQALSLAIESDPYAYDKEGFADLVGSLFTQQFSPSEKRKLQAERAVEAPVDLEEELRLFLRYGYFSAAFHPKSQQDFKNRLNHYFTESLKRGKPSKKEQKLWLKLYQQTNFITLLPTGLQQKIVVQLLTKEQQTLVRLLEVLEASMHQLSEPSRQLALRFVEVAKALLHNSTFQWEGSATHQVNSFIEHITAQAAFSKLEVQQLLQEVQHHESVQKHKAVKRVVEQFSSSKNTATEPDEKTLKQFIANWVTVFELKGKEAAQQRLFEQLQAWEKQYQLDLEQLIFRLNTLVKSGWYDQPFLHFVATIQVENGEYISFEEGSEIATLNSFSHKYRNATDQLILSFIYDIQHDLEEQIFSGTSERKLIQTLQRIYERYNLLSDTFWQWIAEDHYGIFQPSFRIKWKALKKSRAFQNLVKQQQDLAIETASLKRSDFQTPKAADEYILTFIDAIKSDLIEAALSSNSEEKWAKIMKRISKQYSVAINIFFDWILVDYHRLFEPSFKQEWEGFGSTETYQRLVSQQQEQLPVERQQERSGQLTTGEANRLITSFIYSVKSDLIARVNSSTSEVQLMAILQQIADSYTIAPETFWNWISKDRLHLFDAEFHKRWNAFGKSKAFKKLAEQQQQVTAEKRMHQHVMYVLTNGQLPWWNVAYSWKQFEKELVLFGKGNASKHQKELKKIPSANWLKMAQQHVWEEEAFYQLLRLYLHTNSQSQHLTVIKLAQQLENQVYAPLERYGVLSFQLRQALRKEVLQFVMVRPTDKNTLLQTIIKAVLGHVTITENKQVVIQQFMSLFTAERLLEVRKWLAQQQVVDIDQHTEVLSQLLQNEQFYIDPVKAFLEHRKKGNRTENTTSVLELIVENYKQHPNAVRIYFTNETFVQQVLAEETPERVYTTLLPLFSGEQLTLYKETNNLLLELKKHLTKKEADEIWMLWNTALFFHLGTGGIRNLGVQKWKFLFHQVIRKVKGEAGLMQLMHRIQQDNGDDNPNAIQLGIGWTLTEVDKALLTENEVKRTTAIEKEEEEEKPYKKLGEKEEREFIDPIYVKHCGLVILAPYLARLFNMCNISAEQLKEDATSQESAVQLLMYASTGQERFAENEAVVAKVLCGMPITTPVDCNKQLAPEHLKAVDGLLNAVTQNWPGLQGTSINGLRETFIQRFGKLEEDEEAFFMHVEEKAFDMLLDRIPWGIGIVNLSWMPKMIQVTWRK